MLEVKVQKLSLKAFNRYGSYADMINPVGEKIGDEPIEFFRDMVQLKLGNTGLASFSVCRVSKRGEIIDTIESHSFCGEAIMPLDGDVLIHVIPALPDGEVPIEKIEVFLVPKGTIVCLHPGVLHHAPYAYRRHSVNVLIVLPERAYANDCTVIPLAEESKVSIV